MKVVRIILYICGGLFIAFIGLMIYIVNFDPGQHSANTGFAQTMTVGGKKVHLVMNGVGSYKAAAEGSDILVNGKKLDLSGGDEFTITINGDGTTNMRPGKP